MKNQGKARRSVGGATWIRGWCRSSILGALALVLCGVSASAQNTSALQTVRLRWEGPTNTADAPVSGFRLYRTPNTGTEESVDLGNVQGETTLDFLRSKSYRLQLTAYGPGGESDRSNELTLPAVPDAPRKFEIVIPAEGTPTIREIP